MKKAIIALILALGIFMSFAVVSYAEDVETQPGITVTVTDEDSPTEITDEKTSEAVSESTDVTQTAVSDTDTTLADTDDSESVTIINTVLTQADGEEENVTLATDEASIPETGDNSRLAPAVIVLVVSAAFIALLVIKKKKAPEKTDKKGSEDNEDKG